MFTIELPPRSSRCQKRKVSTQPQKTPADMNAKRKASTLGRQRTLPTSFNTFLAGGLKLRSSFRSIRAERDLCRFRARLSSGSES